jgi:plasmid maintenance system antidote protein VapI
MAISLSAAFGGSAESWIIQQAQYDLRQAKRNVEVKPPSPEGDGFKPEAD